MERRSRDQLLPWVLFAYREVLFLYPFDLVFERNIKRILIKQSWLKDDLPELVRPQSVIDYVFQLRERIRSSLDIVNENEQVAMKRSKFWYDMNAKLVSYKECTKKVN